MGRNVCIVNRGGQDDHLCARPIHEQPETLSAYADRLALRYQAARAQVARLTPALLAKAFRGELVAQDPADEPAGVLLARLRGARE